MPALWKPLLVVAALATVARATDPPKPYQLPLTPFEILAVVHTETSDDAVIRKLKESGTRFAPGAPELRQLRQLGVSDKVLAAIMTEPQVVQATFTTPLPPAKSGRPVGTWVREVGDMRIVLKFTEDRLAITASIPMTSRDALLTVDADYSVNPEGLIYGVISGIDADHPEVVAATETLTRHTFSVRCRVEGTVLTVKELMAFGCAAYSGSENHVYSRALSMASGRYMRDDDAKPVTSKKAKPQTLVVPTGSLIPPIMDLPDTLNPYCGCNQVIVVSPECAASEALGPLPAKAGYVFTYCDVPEPFFYMPTTPEEEARVASVRPPSPDRAAVLQSLGRRVARVGYIPPPLPVPLIPRPPETGSSQQQEPTLDVCAHPSIRSSMSATSAASDTLVGSWIRETEGIQVIAKFTEKRAFLTVNVAFTDGEQEQRGTFRLEADYAIGPDGNAFGVITGADITPSKGDPVTREMERAMAAALLAEVTGSPFCFRFRIDDGSLSVRDLRCGEFSPRSPNATALVGLYKPLGSQEAAPPKPGQLRRDLCPTCGVERIGVDFGTPSGVARPSTRQLPWYISPVEGLPDHRGAFDTCIQFLEVAPAPRAVRR